MSKVEPKFVHLLFKRRRDLNKERKLNFNAKSILMLLTEVILQPHLRQWSLSSRDSIISRHDIKNKNNKSGCT